FYTGISGRIIVRVEPVFLKVAVERTGADAFAISANTAKPIDVGAIADLEVSASHPGFTDILIVVEYASDGPDTVACAIVCAPHDVGALREVTVSAGVDDVGCAKIID